MKLISLGASFKLLTAMGTDFDFEHFAIITNVNEILNQILLKFDAHAKCKRYFNIISVSSRLIKYCGIVIDSKGLLSLPIPPPSITLFMNIYKILKDEPLVNGSWFLNLFYLAVLCPQNALNPNFLIQLVDWFFTLSPSKFDTCQLLEIISVRNNQKHLIPYAHVIKKLGFKSVLFSKIYQQCPSLCKSFAVPLKARIKVMLRKHRTFRVEPLKLNLSARNRNNFRFLVLFIIETGNSIFNHNCAIFNNNNNSTFKSLDQFFEHFLKMFLTQQTFYDRLGVDSSGDRPIILPNLKCPKKVLKIVFLVLSRSVVLNFKIPFSIPSKLFCAALTITHCLRHSSVLRVKLLFFNNFFIENNYELIKIEQVNQNDNDSNLLMGYLSSCTDNKSKSSDIINRRTVPDRIVFKLIIYLLEGIHSGVFETFLSEVPFTCFEIYNLMFNRQNLIKCP